MSEMHGHGTGSLEPFDHEIASRPILKSAIWLAVVTVASFAAAYGLYRWFAGAERAADPTPSPILEARQPVSVPGPRLQATPEGELASLRDANRTRLEGWGWVDPANGVAHVPIERAIDEVAARQTLPDFAPPAEEAAPAP
jgi:hypothetical protein